MQIIREQIKPTPVNMKDLANKFRCQGPCGQIHDLREMKTYIGRFQRRFGLCPKCFPKMEGR